ncbi:hypothetical protein P7C70_g3019, partial [Phenoliferia sp. Uapishka_3]
MPPKRKAEAEPPASQSSGSEADEPEKKTKKPAAKKAAKGPVTPLDPSLPHNLTIPVDLEPFPTKADGIDICMECVRNQGLRKEGALGGAGSDRPEKGRGRDEAGSHRFVTQGLSLYVEAEDADILVLSETKTGEPSIEALTSRYPHRYWGVDPKKGNAGLAILSKLEPIAVTFGMPTTEEAQPESAGRIITLEFENSYVVGTYVQNAGQKLAVRDIFGFFASLGCTDVKQSLQNLSKKEAWNVAFETYLRQLTAKKPVIWTGDLNVVPTENDIRNWKTNYNKSAGCTDSEINAFNAQLNPPADSGHEKLVDVWRNAHPEAVKQCEIRLEIYGASDHVPVMLDLEGPL